MAAADTGDMAGMAAWEAWEAWAPPLCRPHSIGPGPGQRPGCANYPELHRDGAGRGGVAVFVDSNGDRIADLAFILAGANVTDVTGFAFAETFGSGSRAAWRARWGAAIRRVLRPDVLGVAAAHVGADVLP